MRSALLSKRRTRERDRTLRLADHEETDWITADPPIPVIHSRSLLQLR